MRDRLHKIDALVANAERFGMGEAAKAEFAKPRNYTRQADGSYENEPDDEDDEEGEEVLPEYGEPVGAGCQCPKCDIPF